GQLPLEARVLCVERVVAGLGGLNGFRVLALRDASGRTERDKGESGDRHERLAHLWSPRSQKSGELPAIHYCKGGPGRRRKSRARLHRLAWEHDDELVVPQEVEHVPAAPDLRERLRHEA